MSRHSSPLDAATEIAAILPVLERLYEVIARRREALETFKGNTLEAQHLNRKREQAELVMCSIMMATDVTDITRDMVRTVDTLADNSSREQLREDCLAIIDNRKATFDRSEIPKYILFVRLERNPYPHPLGHDYDEPRTNEEHDNNEEDPMSNMRSAVMTYEEFCSILLADDDEATELMMGLDLDDKSDSESSQPDEIMGDLATAKPTVGEETE